MTITIFICDLMLQVKAKEKRTCLVSTMIRWYYKSIKTTLSYYLCTRYMRIVQKRIFSNSMLFTKTTFEEIFIDLLTDFCMCQILFHFFGNIMPSCLELKLFIAYSKSEKNNKNYINNQNQKCSKNKNSIYFILLLYVPSTHTKRRKKHSTYLAM